MARFFFHLRDGIDVALDPEGIELPNLEAAQKKALEAARDTLSHDLKAGCIDVGLRIDVENDVGSVLHTQSFQDAFEITGKASRTLK